MVWSYLRHRKTSLKSFAFFFHNVLGVSTDYLEYPEHPHFDFALAMSAIRMHYVVQSTAWNYTEK